MAEFKFIQLSDLHISHNYNDKALSRLLKRTRTNPTDNLINLLRHIKKNYTDLDFLIVTGDLTFDGAVADYGLLSDILEKEASHLPVILSLGNRDVKRNFRRGYLNGPTYNGPLCYEDEVGGLKIICLDTAYDDSAIGYITLEQLYWLDDILQEETMFGRILMLHHPPEIIGPENSVTSYLENAHELYEVIRGSDIMCIFSGHTHQSRMSMFGEIPQFTCSSTAYGCQQYKDHFKLNNQIGFNYCFINESNISVNNIPAIGTVISEIFYDDELA